MNLLPDCFLKMCTEVKVAAVLMITIWPVISTSKHFPSFTPSIIGFLSERVMGGADSTATSAAEAARRDAALAATWLSPGGSRTPHSPPPSPKRPWSGWLCRRRSSSQPKVPRHSGRLCVEWPRLQYKETARKL